MLLALTGSGRRLHLPHFSFLKGNGAADENARDDPYSREKADAKEQPTQRESPNACGHEFRIKIIRQWQTEENNEKRSRAQNRKAKLFSHERMQKRFAVNVYFVRGPHQKVGEFKDQGRLTAECV